MTSPIDRLNAALQGRYRIERELGEGGMATVYLARDLKHNRSVALKVLKPELAAVVGAERFLAEIQTTANLQHPHILPLFDSGEADTFLFYVMPYVEGETLRTRLDREHQLPVEDAVRIATDIAEGLEYAHTRGVLHRDIKPANILLQGGKPVISDFGIAIAVGAAGGGRLTETGLSVGTPHYMSPEQATGDPHLGVASDVYALGCVAYEMLVGEPPYTGTTAQAILGRIIAGELESTTAQRPSVPPHVDAAVRKSLEKLPADRFRSARDFARALSDPGFRHRADPIEASTGSAPPWRGAALAGWGVAALSIAAAAWLFATRPAPEPVRRFPMVLPAEEPLFFSGPTDLPRFDLIPDGSALVYTAGSAAEPRLWLRSFGELQGRALAGTESGTNPAVSPDGSRVAFLTPGGRLAVASLAGGSAVTAVESGVTPGVAWGSDDWIYYVGEGGFELRRVRADGTRPEAVVQLDRSVAPGGFGFVEMLPGERGALVTAFPEERSQITEFAVHVVELASGRSMGSVPGLYGVYADSGHLLYVTSGGVLTGAELDAGSLRLSPRSVTLAEGLDVRGPGRTDLSIADNGTLAYASPSLDTPEKAVFVSTSGAVEGVDPTWDELLEFEGMALSPTGDRLVLAVQSIGRLDLWVKVLGGGSWSRFVPGGSGTHAPAWTPDGRSISFVTASEPSIVKIKPADGSSAERDLVDVGRPVREMRWSHDGEWLVFSVEGPPDFDIFAWRVNGAEPPFPLIAGPFDEFTPTLSADRRFLAYVSLESGSSEVIVVPFPDVEEGRNQISRGGGDPVWDRSVPRLYFRRDPEQADVMVADFSAGLRSAVPRTLFTLPPGNDYEVNSRDRLVEVAPDGRFVFIERSGVFGVSGHPVIVQNFFRELRERVGGGS